MIQATELRTFIHLLQIKQPFTFSRWGDGEWNAVLGKVTGRNCDGHDYFPELGRDLQRVLTGRPTYRLGMQPYAVRQMGDRIDDWLAARHLNDLQWLDADVFHRASIAGELWPLIDTIRKRDVVIVGPDHLKQLHTVIPFRAFVDVPPRNAYLAWQEIADNTLAALEGQRPQIVSVSAGMPAEIIIDTVHRHYRGNCPHTLIDFGSLWDIYCGVRSRKYMRKMPVPEVS